MLLWMLACTTSTQTPDAPDTPDTPHPEPTAQGTQTTEAVESDVPFTSLRDAASQRPNHIMVTITEDPEGALRLELPSRRAAVRGFKAETTATGGKRITLDEGPITQARWVTSKLETLAKDPKSLESLRAAGFSTYVERDVLEVRADAAKSSTYFAFSGDKVAGICNEVSILELSGTSAAFTVRKPVIYAYPDKTTELRIAVDPEGRFTTTYPRADDGIWTVKASPDGVLTDRDGRRHRYLFWEAESEGFVIDRQEAHLVSRGRASNFLESVCDAYALTDFECGDFVTYWLPALQQHPYNVVSFPTEAYEAWAPMQIDPEPDTVIRLFMAFEGADKPVKVGSPPLPKLDREGFTVVEWGGVEMRPPAH